MDKAEAMTLLKQKLDGYRKQSYFTLAEAVGQVSREELCGPSGIQYQIEVQLFWDDKPGGTIRMVGSIDDRGLRAFVPVTETLLIAPGTSTETGRATGGGGRSMGGSLFIAAGLQVGAVLIGYFWGVAVHYPGRPPSTYTFCAQLAGLLMLGGVFASLVGYPVEKARYRTSVCVASLLYSVGIVFCEPFLHVQQFSEIVVAALVLVPLLLALGYLVRGEAWLSLAGVTLVVFTSSAMIASNANVSDGGSGFFSWWR